MRSTLCASLPGQPKAAEGPAFLAGFVPEVLTGILVIFQGFSELLGERENAEIQLGQRTIRPKEGACYVSQEAG